MLPHNGRCREEVSALRRMSLELQSRHPDVQRVVEAAVLREQSLQEERNRKVSLPVTHTLMNIKHNPHQKGSIRMDNVRS